MGASTGSVHYQRLLQQPPLLPARLDELAREQSTLAKGRLHVGLGRAFDPALVVNRHTAAPAEWTTLPGGWRIFSIEVTSPGALGLRVHLEGLALPKGARLVVYASDHPERVAAPVLAEALPAEREVWVETIFAERVVVECQVPPGTDPAEASFAVTGVSHVYRLPTTQAQSGIPLKEGPCHNDVTCYPGYAREADGVALISFIEGGNSYICSGCLLTNTVTSVPADYFLTAHHCIKDQSAASTLELYWFYQTSTCNGTPPDVHSVPQTGGGADLLAGSADQDFAFLRLREAPPQGTCHLSWSRATPSFAETLACIHHPDASYKRINFGVKVFSDFRFWHVQWDTGVCEPGSSGSPLLNAKHQVIGQLYGGYSGCENPYGIDFFGRLDLAYHALKQWLDPLSVLSGTYNGLFQPAEGLALEQSGSFTLTLRAGGNFSGKLQAARARYAFSGRFDTDGNARVTTHIGSLGALALDLHLDVAGGTERITGTVSGDTWTSPLAADRAVFNGKKASSPQAGQYTLLLPDNGDASAPGGASYGTVSVSKSGRARLAGLLADGTPLTQAAIISKYGQWPVYVSLYGGQGAVLGWISFTNTPAADLLGTVAWLKPSLPKAKYYAGGFAFQTAASGSRYQRPSAGEPVVNMDSAALVLSGANLPANLTNYFSLTANQVTDASHKFRLTFSPSNGSFKGSIADPHTSKAISFSGVVLQDQHRGAGWFLNGSQSGQVLLQQAP